MQYIIVSGNPVDGFEHIGLFNNGVDACDYADKWLKNRDWWVVLLQQPAEEDNNAELF